MFPASLKDGLRRSETAVEDEFIRRFMTGTWHGLVCSEVCKLFSLSYFDSIVFSLGVMRAQSHEQLVDMHSFISHYPVLTRGKLINEVMK